MEGEAAPVEPTAAQGMARRPGLISELQRRQVFRVAVAYAVGAWLAVQVTATVSPAFGLPPTVLMAVIILAAVGIVPAMLLAWSYDLTPLGLRRTAPAADATPESIETERRAKRLLTRFTIAGAVLALLVAAGAAALRTAGVGPFAPPGASLAVLPFADLSPQRDQGYFADGVAEEILSLLADDPGIRVVGRTSAAQFRDRSADMKAIREALDVSHVLEGSVRTQGGRLRMSVRLVRTTDGDQIWAETYDRELADVFAVQDEIGRTVAGRLRGTLVPRRSKRAGQATPTGVDAYSLHLAARALMHEREVQSLEKARALLKQAIAADPNYGPAQAAYAQVTYNLSDAPLAYGRLPEAQAIAEARPYAERAIRLAPRDAGGYAALALLVDADAAVALLRRAIELDPSRGELQLWLGLRYEELGRNADALRALEAAYAIEPVWRLSVNRLVHTLAASGRLDEAAALIDRYERGVHDPAAVARWRGVVAAKRGDLSEGLRQLRTAQRVNPDLPWLDLVMASLLNTLGFPNDALVVLSPQRRPLARLLVAGDTDAVARNAAIAGATMRPDLADDATAALAGARRWPDVVRLYDARHTSPQHACAAAPMAGTSFALALRAVERNSEAAALLACVEGVIAREHASGVYVAPRRDTLVYMQHAQLLAMTGRPAQAIEHLEQAVARGWLERGLFPYTPPLRDIAAFDGLRAEPRYLAVERRLARDLARERREVLAEGLVPAARSAATTRPRSARHGAVETADPA